jgi:adenine-specific DNA-methyltransferase
VERSRGAEVIDTANVRKARGAFFTPAPICDFMAGWAVRSATDAVLEPACGEAVFMEASARRLADLGAQPSEMHIAGTDIHEPSARTARTLLKARGVRARISGGDFLASKPTAKFDAVIGNPPYIRFHDFSGPARAVAMGAALAQGVRLSKLASSWAAFVVHSAAYLKPGGRLAFVLPAELLAANYASVVRRFLLGRFGSVSLIMFEEQVFPGVSTEAVLLFCEGNGGTDHFTVRQLRSVSELENPARSLKYRPASVSDKWTGALLSGLAGPELLADLGGRGSFVSLAEWGRISLGSVTGNNGYFAISPERASELGLGADELVRISPPGSHHLRSIRFTSSGLMNLGRAGAQTQLFRPSAKPSKAAMAYIRRGEHLGVPKAYKCRNRSPWWKVPYVPVADLLVTCMNADTPRLAVNEAKAHHLNSVHGLYLVDEYRDLASALAVASLNSATLLGAELVGRAYGGGILKLEPGEAVKLPLPSPEVVRSVASALIAMTPALRKLIANGLLLDAVGLVDSVVLARQSSVSHNKVVELREARAHLAERRVTRGTKSAEPLSGS